jgi:hypothetical protein
MPIDFGPQRWARVARNARAWWEGTLDRPLVQVCVYGCEPDRPEPELPAKGFTSHYDLSVPAEEIVDRWDYNLCCTRFLGDAFPHVWPNFGPGILAGFLGARVRNRPETTWFEPTRDYELDDLEFALDPGNVWLRRVEDVTRAAMDRWHGSVQVAMTDLGGTLDVLASFRPAERLLMDFHDRPEQVEDLTWQLHELWWRSFERLDAILRGGGNPGYSAWTPLFSESPYYMLQCDLSYMIGPAMFERFVLPELAASCRRLGNPAYHLDGPGQIAHLDMLLGIPELKVIQYVPTGTERDPARNSEVYRRIRAGGKLNQVYGNHYSLGPALMDVLAEQLGDARGVAMVAGVPAHQEEQAREFLRKWGIDEE